MIYIHHTHTGFTLEQKWHKYCGWCVCAVRVRFVPRFLLNGLAIRGVESPSKTLVWFCTWKALLHFTHNIAKRMTIVAPCRYASRARARARTHVVLLNLVTDKREEKNYVKHGDTMYSDMRGGCWIYSLSLFFSSESSVLNFELVKNSILA